MRPLFTPTVRISLGLVSLTLSFVLVAFAAGLLPDTVKAELDARVKVAEALAVQLAGAASRNDDAAIEDTMAAVVTRGGDVLSVAVRQSDGEILQVAGPHDIHWAGPKNGLSTPTHVQVPLYDGGSEWGRVEIAFRPLQSSSVIYGIPSSLLYFIGYVAVAGFVGYFLMLRRALRELDPSQVIPERVKSAFDTLAEGLLILDERGNVILANNAFLKFFKSPPMSLAGMCASNLEWTDWDTGSKPSRFPWQETVATKEALRGASLGLGPDHATRRRLIVNTAPILDGGGAVRGVMATFDDATLLDMKNEELAEAVSQLQDFSQHLEERVAERTRAAEQSAISAHEAKLRLQAEVSERRKAEMAVAEQRDVLSRQQQALSALTSEGKISASDWQGSLDLLTATCGRMLGAARTSLWIGPGADGQLACASLFSAATGKHAPGPVLDITAAPAFHAALKSGSPITAADARNDHRLAALSGIYLDPNGITAMMCMPVIHEGKVAGMLTIEETTAAPAWTTESQVFVTSISNLAALALEARQRAQVEDDLRSTNKALSEASRAKSEFLANMSHEIRTPMNGVFGMTDLLMKTELNDRQLRFVNTISQSAKSLLVIINDILDLSRIESGKLEIDSHDFDLASSIEDASLLLADEAQKKGLAFNLFVDPRAARAVTGDSGRLRQILLNLIGNAVKFTNKGEISVKVRSEKPEPGQETFRFEIADTGIGIAPDVLSRLFKPFEQADSSITRRFGGTGLGLSISRHLVSMMGGDLGIESTPGAGTRIWFTLPLSYAGAESAAAETNKTLLAGRRILVLDEHAISREIAGSYLAASGARADLAESLEQALAMLAATRAGDGAYELAVVDLHGGSTCGSRLSSAVAGDPALARIPFIGIAPVSLNAKSRETFESTGATIISAPLRREEFLKAVLTGLDTVSSAHPAATTPPAESIVSLGLKVLVVEDNPINQMVVAEYLTGIGCTSVIASNGKEAVDLSAGQRFDVALMDLQMPVMDGFAATRRIREREQAESQAPMPIVAVTANAFDEDRRICIATGMTDYMSKPFTEQQLIDKLKASMAPAAVSPQPAAPVPTEAPPTMKQPPSLRRPAAQIPASGTAPQLPATTAPAIPAAVPAPARTGPGLGATIESARQAAGQTAAPAPQSPPVLRPAGPPVMPTRPAAPAPAAPAAKRSNLRERLLAIYLDYAPKAMEGLTTAMAGADLESVKHVAHSLKSSSANVNADRVSGLCAELEKHAAAGDLEACTAMTDKLDFELDHFIDAIRSEQAANAGPEKAGLAG